MISASGMGYIMAVGWKRRKEKNKPTRSKLVGSLFPIYYLAYQLLSLSLLEALSENIMKESTKQRKT
jgi:hypothetical protein